MIPYWEDSCPTCGEKATMACRCFRNERRCPNGHWWMRGKDDEPIKLAGPHGSAAASVGKTGPGGKNVQS